MGTQQGTATVAPQPSTAVAQLPTEEGEQLGSMGVEATPHVLRGGSQEREGGSTTQRPRSACTQTHIRAGSSDRSYLFPAIAERKKGNVNVFYASDSELNCPQYLKIKHPNYSGKKPKT